MCFCIFSDKFDYKIYMYKSGDVFGQRIRWAAKDFVDISYAILNSTGHQIVLRQDSEALTEDICIALSLKMLVRWSKEPLPWKQNDRVPMMECQKYLFAMYNSGNKISDFASKDILSHMEVLPHFLESQELMVFSDVEEFLSEDNIDGNDKISLTRVNSNNSSSGCDSNKRQGELNIEDPDDLEDDIDSNTNGSSKYRLEADGDDLTTSGFIDDRSEYTGGGSWIDSVL